MIEEMIDIKLREHDRKHHFAVIRSMLRMLLDEPDEKATRIEAAIHSFGRAMTFILILALLVACWAVSGDTVIRSKTAKLRSRAPPAV
jgi:hypothetical protein